MNAEGELPGRAGTMRALQTLPVTGASIVRTQLQNSTRSAMHEANDAHETNEAGTLRFMCIVVNST